jgi:putative transposase
VVQPEAVVGIDLGVTTLATLSTGEIDRRPEVAQGGAQAAAAGEQGPGAQAARLGQFPQGEGAARPAASRIANVRRDATHKLTTRLAKTYRVIGIEDLNVRGMARNRHLARAIWTAASTSFVGNSTTRPSSTVRG